MKRIAVAFLFLFSAAIISAQPTTIGGLLPQLPKDLGALGGLKVECLSGCGGGGGVGSDINIASVGGVAVGGANVPVTGPLTDVQLRASAVPVSGTFWQATQPVSGPLTDAQLRASEVPVSGTFWPTAAGLPLSARLSDGTNFYNGATDRTTAGGPFSNRLTDGTGFLDSNTSYPSGSERALAVRPYVPQRTTAAQNLNALNATCELDVDGYAGGQLIVATGTLAATLIVETTTDNSIYETGTAWLQAVAGQSGAKVSTLTVTNPNTRAIFSVMAGAGVKKIRVRNLLYTSGTASCVGYAGSYVDPFALALSANTDGLSPNFWYPMAIGARSSESTTATGLSSGANRAIVGCDKTFSANIVAAATVAIQAPVTGQSVYVCGYTIQQVGAAAPPTLKLVGGTGAACAAAVVDLTPTYTGSTTVGAVNNITFGTGLGYVTKTAASSGLCYTSTTAVAQKLHVIYAIF